MSIPKTPVLLLAAAALAAACTPQAPPGDGPEPRGAMRAFRSEQAFAGYVRRAAREQREWQRRQPPMPTAVPSPPAPPPAPVEAAPSAPAASAPAAKEAESVTNVQTAGVDEGGIVKVHGEHLVMLRRGRLFTVRIGDGGLRPVSAVDAFGPGIDPGGAWYDEMLVSGDQVIVIGYSYQRGGTEVGIFGIDSAGTLAHRSTWHLRSNDYYSSRNYASRLVGGKLVFYTPLSLPLDEEGGVSEALPAMRRWHPGVTAGEWRTTLSPTRVHLPERRLDPRHGLVLHTVTSCGLAGGEMDCTSTAVVGPWGRVFYVASDAVYVWVTEPDEEEEDDDDEGRRPAPRRPASMVYRMPLDGSGPAALGVSGAPVDQFSFLESPDRHLNVLVRSDGSGDGMWGAEVSGGDVALMRVPLRLFGDGGDDAPAASYRPLPRPAGYTFQNRFVGGHLLYGGGSGGWVARPDADTARTALYAVPWAGGPVTALGLSHGTDRIEAMGGDAVVVGTGGPNLYFTAVRLGGASPEPAGRYTLPGASQGETRSHGFFYRPEGEGRGMLGLPVASAGRPGHAQLRHGSASILFLRNAALEFEELGQLASGPTSTADDGCRASCVDWYGNARPLFLRGRIFALMGYEIVEGTLAEGRIRETRRITYAPR